MLGAVRVAVLLRSGVEMTPERGGVRRCREDKPFGEKMTPEQGFLTGFRMRLAFRREIDAGTGVPDGNPYETGLPARKWRRYGGF